MSVKYFPAPPGAVDPTTYAYGELQDLSRALAEPQEVVQLQVLYVEPVKPRDGLVVFADGVEWDPSDGAGIYGYLGGSWVPLHTGGGGGGAVATDSIWDAKGDLAVGTGANTAAKLTVGTDDYVLTADSTQATGLKWAAVPASGLTQAQVLARGLGA